MHFEESKMILWRNFQWEEKSLYALFIESSVLHYLFTQKLTSHLILDRILILWLTDDNPIVTPNFCSGCDILFLYNEQTERKLNFLCRPLPPNCDIMFLIAGVWKWTFLKKGFCCFLQWIIIFLNIKEYVGWICLMFFFWC